MSNYPTPAGSSALAERGVSRQYLTFTLGGELFAMPIEQIREIIEFAGMTEIPLMPAFLRGVINMRGAVVPVIDLAVRFGRERTEIARRTCIVIIEVEQEGQMLLLGVLVDAVNEVLTVEPGQVEQRPAFGARIRAEFIEGMINLDQRFVIALDIRLVLSVEELATLIGVAAEAGAVTAE
ncbi:chemotaxis protein CheW [Chitiniphilus eburneus]|uniref:Purine-binding chemotaxis protein CheW n=1 Tax=Chitiniphilus eburneus TaxID=2571148 RepID=A0A4U0QRY5_9NEIS|nr:chemotaxis protein CheW [Chitiniphilus eburneus]TJZ79004.1 purine-binding chemotaxis protein CheW [Chitiniphilus eburneus]